MSQENIANPIPDLALVSPPEIAPESTPHLDNSVIHLDDYRQAGLPAMAYTSAKFLKQERETLFAHYWVCVGLASDVPNPGDVYPTDLAGMPIVLVRGDRQGTLRAFHNICSHRGLELVNQPCNVQGNLRCPYHSWAYKLDGSLKSTPHFGGYYKDSYEGFDRQSKGLQSIRCDQWLDLVFVNLSGDAPPLEEYLAPVIDRWSHLRPEPAAPGTPPSSPLNAKPTGSWRWKTSPKATT